MRILYLLEQFPKLTSEVFILNELAEFNKLGHEIWILPDFINHLTNDEVHSLVVENSLMDRIITVKEYKRGLFKILAFLLKLIQDFFVHPLATSRNFYQVFSAADWLKKNIWRQLDNYLIVRNLANMKLDLVYSPFSPVEKIERGVVVANILRTPLVTSFCALELYGHKNRQEILDNKRLFNQIDGISTISQLNNKILQQIFEIGRDFPVVHEGVYIDKFRPTAPKDKSKKLEIVTIARFVEKKGIEYLLKVLARLKERGEFFSYTLVGSGPLKENYRERIRELGLSEVVTILAPLKQELIKEILEKSDLMVLPCVIGEDGDRDILPGVLIEAMAMEVPVITSNISGIEELVTDKIDGFLVPEKDEIALLTTIELLIKDEKLRKKIGQAGRNKVIRDFNVEIETQKKIKFFENIIKRCQGKIMA